jgi:N utilization substance protein A
MRVQSIIRELRGEKIDIIQWNEDPVQFATNSLSPAKVSRVTLVEGDERQLEVVVEDSQLSLAIGKKGQNVRLASRLLDRRIDIKSEEEKRQEIEAQMASLMSSTARTPVENLKGLGKKTMEKLGEHGISSIEELAAMTPEQLMEIPGVGEKMVQKIADAVKQHFEPDVAEADTPEASAAEVPPEQAPAEESERPAAAVLADAPAPAQEAPPEEEVTEAVTAGSGEEGSKVAEEGGAEKELAAETTESESERAD